MQKIKLGLSPSDHLSTSAPAITASPAQSPTHKGFTGLSVLSGSHLFQNMNQQNAKVGLSLRQPACR